MSAVVVNGMRIVAACLALAASTPFAEQPASAPPLWHYRVLAQRPHDASAFTEGLLIHDGMLVESTGLYGQSGLFVRSWPQARPLRSRRLPASEFGEGIAIAGQRLFQLTWREGLCHVFDLHLDKVADFHFDGEGWGLTFDGRELIRSDGSATLHFHDPADFRETHRIQVHAGAQAVPLLNELEYVQGRLYANVWMSTRIVVVDPADGTIVGWLDLGDLLNRFPQPAGWIPNDNVLNGIAYDNASGHWLVTGKRWPASFEITIETGADTFDDATRTNRKD